MYYGVKIPPVVMVNTVVPVVPTVTGVDVNVYPPKLIVHA